MAPKTARGKRARDEAGPSERLPTFPWPRYEHTRITNPRETFDLTGQQILKSSAFLDRPISEQWDIYDTYFYNHWLEVEMLPTRFLCEQTTDRLGITAAVHQGLQDIGLGTMATTVYPLYPDLVRQFLATARVYYTTPGSVHDAKDGILTFMAKGTRYRISFPEICRLYGFDRSVDAVALGGFGNAAAFWQAFGEGTYNSRQTAHSDIRHPVVRYLVKVLCNTILCKDEANKMRQQELILLYHAFGHLVDIPAAGAPRRANLGSIFAHHLVELKSKAVATGKKSKRFETVGSLLSPIFERMDIDVSNVTIKSVPVYIGEEYLRSAHILKTATRYCFRMDGVSYAIDLPQTDFTSVDSREALAFRPPVAMLYPLATRQRGGSSAAPMMVDDEEEDIPEFGDPAGDATAPSGSGSAPAYSFSLPEVQLAPEVQEFMPSPPPDCSDAIAYRQWTVRQSYKQTSFMGRLWDRMARCTCMAPPPPPRRSPPPP